MQKPDLPTPCPRGRGTTRLQLVAGSGVKYVTDGVYARAFCCGDQPRFIARSAYDFTFWMGLLSTQPIPVPAGDEKNGKVVA